MNADQLEAEVVALRNLVNELVRVAVGNGDLTINQVRAAEGLSPYSFRQANEPFLATPTGPAFLDPGVPPVGLPTPLGGTG